MPIVVDEVVISVDVAAPSSGAPGAPGATRPSPGASPDDRQELVNECVERVLEILAQRRER